MAGSGALAIATALACAARWHWAFDLLTHFPVQYAVAGCMLLAVLVGLRRPRWAVLPLLVVIVNAAQFLPIYLPAEARRADGAPAGRLTYRAVSANVYTANRNQAAFLKFIQTQQPDFFLVMEIDDRWAAKLRQLESQYPHSVVRPRPDNFGIGLYSRAPIRSVEVVEMTPAALPTIRATLALGDGALTVIGTHPLPPVGRSYSTLRNRQLAELGELVASIPDPQVVLGDLNVTPWSPHFSDLLARGRLRDSRQGLGVQPSWPSLPWPMQIPIDHALVSADVHVVTRRLGPPIGSDHRPIVLEFRLAD